ncbi:MAG TPA: hypothetical protein VHZ50_03400, partial [Puia sp.]|nr:hypothetical protein [Puia sp.]
LTVFSIIFLAVIVTFYFSKGMGEKKAGIDMAMQIIIIAVAGIISFNLVEKEDVMVFNYPLFWIAIGTLFYFLIALLVNIIPSGNEGEKDRIVLLNIASLVRYVFYAFAVLYTDDGAEDHSSFR